VLEGSRAYFPDGLTPDYWAVLNEEFRLIRSCKYAPYFLTVHDIVRHARSLDPPILCQGRGSAANSLVCYFLGITPIDPVREKLLFSVSCPRRATNRPTLTSISNMNGAKRSCNISMPAMAATAPGLPPPSSITARAARSAKWARH
jgi:hypothetical protein